MEQHVQLSITFTDRGAVVAMSGDLTWSSGGSLRTVFEATVGDARHVEVDIIGLESLDPAGEAILADCIADAHWRGADVVLRTQADGYASSVYSARARSTGAANRFAHASKVGSSNHD